VPVGVDGSKGSRLGAFWRRDVTFRFGEPFRASELTPGDDRAAADDIMRRVAALLPPEMRGVYASADPKKDVTKP
jgi:hypothetical protein